MITILNILDEKVFGGKICRVEFVDDRAKDDGFSSKIPGVRELSEYLLSQDNKPLPKNLVPKKLTSSKFFKIRKGNARAKVFLFKEMSTLIIIDVDKRDENTYDDITDNTYDDRLQVAIERIRKRGIEANQNDENYKMKNTNNYNVISVTPIKGDIALIVEFNNKEKIEKMVYDLNPLIGDNTYLKNESVFKTAKLAGNYVEWSSGVKISLHDIFNKCDGISEEEYQNLLNERWRRRRGRYLLYR